MKEAHCGRHTVDGGRRSHALDGTPVAQTLASQPLVTATILGALWGDWSTALGVGVVLQILAASTLPIRARTPGDYSVGGVVSAGVALHDRGRRAVPSASAPGRLARRRTRRA